MENSVSISWDLGLETNNMAEFLTLWKGLEVAIEKKIPRLTVFGDSMIIMGQMMKARESISSLSPHMNLRLLNFVSQFEKLEIYRIVIHLNSGVDMLAKKVFTMEQGGLEMDNNVCISPIP